LSLAIIRPAFAAGVFTVPDPTDFTLFALGIAGLVVGRYAATKRPRD
jgi:hypothetical protein